MAYFTILASVSPDDVQLLRRDASHLLSPSHFEPVSHYLAYSVVRQPLGSLLGKVLDGGEPINSDLWHPLRAPIVHTPDTVRGLLAQIQDEFEKLLSEATIPDDDWYHVEITKVVSVLRHAVSRSECVVNVMEPPFDAERADRVRIPFKLMGPRKGQKVTQVKKTFIQGGRIVETNSMRIEEEQ